MSRQEECVGAGVAWVDVIRCPRVVGSCAFATYPAGGGRLPDHLGSGCVVASIVRSVGLGSLGLPGGLACVAASWVCGEAVAGEAGALDGHGATRGGRAGRGRLDRLSQDWGRIGGWFPFLNCRTYLQGGAWEPPPPYRGVGWFPYARWVLEGGSQVVPELVPKWFPFSGGSRETPQKWEPLRVGRVGACCGRVGRR